MNAFRATVRGRTPAAKLLLAACGLAGCTGGPAISSVSAQPPAALDRSEQRALAAGESAGRAGVAEWPAPVSRPIWTAGHDRSASPATTDPFAETGAIQPSSSQTFARRPASAVRTTDTRSPLVPAPVKRVSHAAVEPACGSPADEAARATSVVEAGNHRLPPAAPLGSERRATRTTSTSGSSRVASPHVSSSQTIDATPVSRTTVKPSSDAPVPLDDFLVERERARASGANRVTNEDMIVDSALLPKRAVWREEATVRDLEGERANFPITPRRPFSVPMWEPVVDVPPSATANLPVSLSPADPVPTEPVSLVKAMPAPAEIPFEAAPQVIETPTAGPTIDNPFMSLAPPAVAEPIQTSPEEQKPVLTAGPLLAPGSALASGPIITPGPAEVAGGGPALAAVTTTVTTPPARLTTTSAAAARPVDLSGAERAAAQAAAAPRTKLSTPLTIGLALAAVAIGAVMIRRRFA